MEKQFKADSHKAKGTATCPANMENDHHNHSSAKLPNLIECDQELWTDYLGDYLCMWLKNSQRFFEDQKAKMRWLAFCPFLFGITDNLPMPWIRIFVKEEVLHRHRIHDVDFTPVELDTLDMADVIFQCCADLIVRNHKDLKEILNFINEIEERYGRRDFIDTNFALSKLVQLKVFPSLWNPLRRSFERKKKQAHLLILYFFKTIHHQIVHYGRDGQDKAELVREAEAHRARIYRDIFPEAEPHSEEAFKALKEGRLEKALEHFTKAINYETLSSVDYCGRAETYIQMEKFMNALPDCWRSMVLDQKNSSKPCYQASRCYYEMGSLERAMEMNGLALEFCGDMDHQQKKLIEDQTHYIEKAKTNRRTNRHKVLSESEADPVEKEKTSVVFRKLQCEGSSLYQNEKYREAAEKFHEALEMVASLGLKTLETQVEDVQLLTYCYGLACIHTKIYSNLQSAIEKFKHLINEGFKPPSSHFGLGLAYKNLNRFTEALLEFQQALENKKLNTPLQWPQTVVSLGETDPIVLQKLLKSVIRECKHPPKPDAICKFHSDTESTRTEIYLSDPDYKGFIRLICNCQCCIEFHSGCWKTFRHSRGEHIDKEMLDKLCPTPDCWGLITHISIFKLDIDYPIEMTSSRKLEPKPHICKPVVKMKTTNALKLQRRAEKKQLRKERREEERKKKEEEKLFEEAPDTHRTYASSYTDIENDLQNLNTANQTFTVLVTKDQEDPAENKSKQKATKPKKKKEKTKQVLTFDLQFAADKDKELLGADSLDRDGDYISQPGLMGGAPVVPLHFPPAAAAVPSMMPAPVIPLALPRPVVSGNGLLPLPVKAQPVVDVFLQNLIECFVTILQGGPQDLSSGIVLDILSSVPSETRARVAAAGGIATFLNSHPQFVVANGKVGLAKGGLGLLSTGPATTTKKTPNGNGLLETPPISSPWKLGASAQLNNNHHTGQGLLGAFPQLSLHKPLSAEKPENNWRSLNPSAQEFVPGPRQNFPDNNNSVFQNGVEIEDKGDKDQDVKDEDESDEESGEFVTVTHKKNSQAKQSLKSSYNQKVPRYQNGVVHNMYNGLREESSSEKFSAAKKSDLLSENSVAALVKESSNGSKNGTFVLPSQPPPPSSLVTIAEAMAPPPPLPVLSIGAQARSRTKSDASSTLSEEVRACSPNSSGSHVSQGSSNSNATSSTAGQGLVPLQPLKGAGLSLPKRSKRRNLLREKIVSLANTQPNLPPPSTTHNLSSAKLPCVMGEVDDIDSIDSSSTSDKDGLESVSLAAALPLKKSLLENKVDNAQPAFKTDEKKEESSGWKLYSDNQKPISPWGSSSYLTSSAQFEDVYRGQTATSSPPLQAAVGSQRRSASRLLRNLALSSHSPSPPLSSDSPLNSGAATLDLPLTSVSTSKDSQVGLMFDSSGNFRTSLSKDELWQDAEIVSSPARPSILSGKSTTSVDRPKVAASKDETKDPWAKPSSQTAGQRFGLGDTLYGAETSKDNPYFPGHHDRGFSSGFSSQLQGMTETAFKGLSSPALLSSAGVAPSDIHTWSPLSSDYLHSEPQGEGQSKASLEAWPTTLPQSRSDQDLDENPFSLNLYKEKTPAMQLKSNGVNVATGWTRSLLQASAQKSVATATASVNTELTGEKLKLFQVKFNETKQERDSLQERIKQEENETSLQKAQVTMLETKLTEVKAELKLREVELEASKQRVEAAEREKDSISQALKQTIVKAEQLDEVTSQLQEEIKKGKSYQREILNLTAQAALGSLAGRRKEASMHVYNLERVIDKICSEDLVVDPILTEKKQEWEEYEKVVSAAFKEVMQAHNFNVLALEQGKSLKDLLPMKAPSLPTAPTLPPQECLVGRPKSKPQPPTREPEIPRASCDSVDSLEDDESAFLKMISQGGAAPTKQQKSNPAPVAAGAPASMRLPPGLPRRPLSQGPIPLNSARLTNLSSQPIQAASSFSSTSSGLASIKLPTGCKVPRQSLAGIAATMTPQPNPQQSQHPDKLTMFERLVRNVQETFPDYSSRQIQRIIGELRRENGGSLSSFNYEALAESIVNRIIDQEGDKTSHQQADILHRVESVSNRRGRGMRPSSPTELTCTICHDSTEPSCGQEIRVLDCGHRFHEDCIQSWLKVNQTCPNCRSHSLLEEDFPSLRKF